MESSIKKNLQKLFYQTFGENAGDIVKLPGAGSHRDYYRMVSGGNTCIGCYSPDPLETRAFLEFTRHFSDDKLNVPRLLAEDAEGGIYLLQDLGDLTLKREVDKSRTDGDYPGSIIPLYNKALDQLLMFQVEGHVGLNYSVCVPRSEFDRQSVLWDLNHFKYYFIKLLGIPFDEQVLEDDFQAFADRLSEAPSDHFMYRDFNSRNIMIFNNDLYFVDYQGGRKGPLQYDVASLLFESRVDLSPDLREELLNHYLEQLKEKTGKAPEEFMRYYYSFVLIRILQVLGAYGLRGVVENKALFLQSIPFAIRNIEWMKENSLIPVELKELTACLDRICNLEEWKFSTSQEKLTVRINSFSYKKGLPRDLSGNGGGFVFDCRALPNPGREEKYRAFTGRDTEVIKFLEVRGEVEEFLAKTFALIKNSIVEYRSRGFNDLMVSYGCTGGQHRSVYSAERLREYLENELNVNTILVHRELD